MKLKSIIKIRFGSLKQCAEVCDIPYSTLYEICAEKTDILQCSCMTAMKLAKGLHISLEELLGESSLTEFRDELHNQKKALGDKKFLVRYLEKNTVMRLWDSQQRQKALYLLAMLDTLCKQNGYPVAKEYNDLRLYRLDKPVYIGDSVLDKEKARTNALREFAIFNIYEGDLNDAL